MGAISAALAGIRCRVACHHQIRTAQHVTVRAIDRVLGSLGVYSQIIAVSQTVGDSFAGYSNSYLSRLRVIPNAIKHVSPHVDRLTVRNSLGIAPDAILVVAVGRLSFEKNLERTLSAIALVPNVQIVLVGDGPGRSDVEACIASLKLGRRVVLAGQVDHQAAVDILFASDVFIQLSLFEGRSIALLEALCARKAIIASDIAAQREALTMPDGRLAGIVADPKDERAIAAAISAVANDEQLRFELGARAATLAQQIQSARMGQEYYVALLMGAQVEPLRGRR
jgi:glycosyltransferase involved in cell wall biosynthesis